MTEADLLAREHVIRKRRDALAQVLIVLTVIALWTLVFAPALGRLGEDSGEGTAAAPASQPAGDVARGAAQAGRGAALPRVGVSAADFATPPADSAAPAKVPAAKKNSAAA